jgi:hypothetical protein
LIRGQILAKAKDLLRQWSAVAECKGNGIGAGKPKKLEPGTAETPVLLSAKFFVFSRPFFAQEDEHYFNASAKQWRGRSFTRAFELRVARAP